MVSQPPADHLPTTYWPPTDHILTTYWPHTDHLLTIYQLPTNHLLTTYRPPTYTDHLPTTYWPPTDHLTYRLFTDHLPTIYWPPTSHFFMVQLVHNYQVYICLTSQDSCGSLCVELDSTRVPQNDGISSTQYVGSCIPTCSTNHDITGGGADEVDGLLRHAKLETIHWVSVYVGQHLMYRSAYSFVYWIDSARLCQTYIRKLKAVYEQTDSLTIQSVNLPYK